MLRIRAQRRLLLPRRRRPHSRSIPHNLRKCPKLDAHVMSLALPSEEETTLKVSTPFPNPHSGIRTFSSKVNLPHAMILRPDVVQIWSRYPQNYGGYETFMRQGESATPLPSEQGSLKVMKGSESHGQNLALTVLHVPYLLCSGPLLSKRSVFLSRRERPRPRCTGVPRS